MTLTPRFHRILWLFAIIATVFIIACMIGVAARTSTFEPLPLPTYNHAENR